MRQGVLARARLREALAAELEVLVATAGLVHHASWRQLEDQVVERACKPIGRQLALVVHAYEYLGEFSAWMCSQSPDGLGEGYKVGPDSLQLHLDVGSERLRSAAHEQLCRAPAEHTRMASASLELSKCELLWHA